MTFEPIETIMTVAVSSHSESYHSNQMLSISSTSNSEICFYSHAMDHSLWSIKNNIHPKYTDETCVSKKVYKKVYKWMYIKNSCSPSELLNRYDSLVLSWKLLSGVINHCSRDSEEMYQRYIPIPSSVFLALLNCGTFLECFKVISKTYFISWSIINSLNQVIASIQIFVFPFIQCTDVDCYTLKFKML